ncbi:MAG: site-2 protease family protein [Firmicutes bacterium]|nr:site-2 protease family protein [Bacillota bacterium]
MSIVIAVIIFGIIVLIHEFGHFAAARKAGIMVEEFAIGMGPKLLKWRRGDTLYSLRLFPIGGFCKMLGEDGSSEDSRAFGNRTLPRRIGVISAGAFMNFLLAFALLFVIVVLNGYAEPVVRRTVDGSAASEAGLKPGDRILRIGGSSVNIFEDVSFDLSTNKGVPVAVEILRGGERIAVTLTPRQDPADGMYKIGFYPDGKAGVFQKAEGFASAGVWECVRNAFFTMIFLIKTTVIGIIRLFTFKLPLSQLSGPIGIVGVINDAYAETIKAGVYDTVLTMVKLCALISANLGAFNLLPLPALDGGRLVFLFIEGIRRKPVPPEREGLVHLIGLAALMILAVFIAYSDIRKML